MNRTGGIAKNDSITPALQELSRLIVVESVKQEKPKKPKNRYELMAEAKAAELTERGITLDLVKTHCNPEDEKIMQLVLGGKTVPQICDQINYQEDNTRLAERIKNITKSLDDIIAKSTSSK